MIQMKFSTKWGIAIAAIIFGISSAAKAQDGGRERDVIIFNVPVNYTNLHRDVEALMVNCSMKRVGEGPTRVSSAGLEYDPNVGSISTNVRIEFTLQANENAADYDNYTCLVVARVGALLFPLGSDRSEATRLVEGNARVSGRIFQ